MHKINFFAIALLRKLINSVSDYVSRSLKSYYQKIQTIPQLFFLLALEDNRQTHLQCLYLYLLYVDAEKMLRNTKSLIKHFFLLLIDNR